MKRRRMTANISFKREIEIEAERNSERDGESFFLGGGVILKFSSHHNQSFMFI